MKAWEGPSLIDGRPIMLCLSGVKRPLQSKKLGDMIQASVLPVDEPPHVAVKSGLNTAVCGDCSRRFCNRAAEPEVLGPQPGEVQCPGKCGAGGCTLCWPHGGDRNVYVEEHGCSGRCYVLPWTAPKRVWGVYVEQEMRGWPSIAAFGAIRGSGRSVRLTTWGDPTAIPLEVWVATIPGESWGPAYTRRWRKHPEWQRLAMASVESLAEAGEAQALGWRTYRVGGRR